MAIWTPELAGRHGPKYLQIVEALAEAIASGTLSPGMKLPPHRELAYALGVSANTTSRAYAEGVARALVQGEVGRGTFVWAPGGWGHSPTTKPSDMAHQTDAAIAVAPITNKSPRETIDDRRREQALLNAPVKTTSLSRPSRSRHRCHQDRIADRRRLSWVGSLSYRVKMAL